VSGADGTPPSALRVANCSGFFGDRLAAAQEMIDGGPIDVLTGDWLAELTMFILHKTRAKSGGYARTFLKQLEMVLGPCVDRGITIVSNAGGLDPVACAEAVSELARTLGLDVVVASVAGDDITDRMADLMAAGERFTNLDTNADLAGDAPLVTANAYLGAAPIAAALGAGAQIVVTGRVTDASVIVGPAMHAFGWGARDLDQVAGAVVAGHVIECGAQCCGGNYAFFDEIPGAEHIGFPIAELAADGSSVITKHPGTGGAVTVGTVTAQLLYEIGGPRYLSPDAVARFDTIAIEEVGPDRVSITKTLGEPPPETLKVTANLTGGYRNAMTFVLTGAHKEAKARMARSAVWAGIAGGPASFTETSSDLSGDMSAEGTAFLRLAVRGNDPTLVGRAFSNAVIETTLANYPGTYFTGAPTGAQEVAQYWPTTVNRDRVTPEVAVGGQTVSVPPWRPTTSRPSADPGSEDTGVGRSQPAGLDHASMVTVPLGVLVGARSGDKGGAANVGLWADHPAVAAWLLQSFGLDDFRDLLPEVQGLEIERFALPNLSAVNFVVHGILGSGVAANLRLDSQAKSLGELVRSRALAVPNSLLTEGTPAAQRLASWE
jgi:Acyclic terpene utilisation family protein AtuA